MEKVLNLRPIGLAFIVILIAYFITILLTIISSLGWLIGVVIMSIVLIIFLIAVAEEYDIDKLKDFFYEE